MASYVVYESSSDWSGLYEDGQLILVGDHYLIDEKLRSIFQVETVQSDDFFLGKANPKYNEVASSLEEVQAYARRRESNEATAEELRQQAQELLAQAAALSEPGAGAR